MILFPAREADNWRGLAPHASVHVTTGAQPTVSMRIPADQYLRAMRQLAVTFTNGAGAYQQAYVYGYYWAAPGNVSAQFNSISAQASAGTPVPNPQTALSVRFIRHA